jgi:carbon monoxide dehydrogenase subunit G
MIVTGTSSVAVAPAELWAILSDPGRLAAALPGVSDISVEDDRHFNAVAHPATALGRTRVAMEFEVADQRAGEYVRLIGSGSAGESVLALSVELELAPEAGGTAASWRAELALRGVLSSLLQRGAGGLLREQVEEVLAAGARISEAERGG